MHRIAFGHDQQLALTHFLTTRHPEHGTKEGIRPQGESLGFGGGYLVSERELKSTVRSRANDRSEVLNQLQSPLLRLPRELRDIIYSYFVRNYWIFLRVSIGETDSPTWSMLKDNQMWPVAGRLPGVMRRERLVSLSETCRQLNAEFALKTFTLDRFEAGLEKFEPLSAKQRDMVKDVCIATDYPGLFKNDSFKYLAAFSGLRRVRIDLTDYPRHASLLAVEESVKEVVGKDVGVFVCRLSNWDVDYPPDSRILVCRLE